MARRADNNIILPEDESVQNAIKRLQKSNEDSYLVVGYEGKAKLKVIAEGVGGIDECKEHFIRDDARYFYLRKSHQVDLSKTVKFAFVDWTPSSAAPLRRALLGTHKGQVNDLFKPAHVTFQWSDQNEINEQAILDRIGFASGTKVHVTENKGQELAAGAVRRTAEYKKPVAKGKDHIPEAVKEGRTLKFADEDAIRAAIKAVRLDADPTQWMVVAYSDVETLQLDGKGEGGIQEMLDSLDEEKNLYAFFRTTEQRDQSVTVKFGFISQVAKKTKPTIKAKISTHRGFVVQLFEPYHNEWVIDSRADLSEEAIRDKIGASSGVKSAVVSAEYREAEKQRQKDRLQKIEEAKNAGPQVSKESLGIVHDDEEAFRRAIGAVRSDEDATTWAVVTLEGKNKLKVIASGEGGAEQLAAALEEKEVNFGLLRVTDKIDESVTVKFVYIKSQPRAIAPQKKATLPTLKGAIDPLFEPYHTDLFIESKAELTPEAVFDKVQSVSGSKSKVLPSAGGGAAEAEAAPVYDDAAPPAEE